MLASLTLALSSHRTAFAGRKICVTATQSGGTSWSTNPLSIGGITNAKIIPGSQTVSGGTSCTAVVYTGDASGTLTVTDSVNGTTATIAVSATYVPPTASGRTLYVTGGIPQVPAPSITRAGASSVGSTLYMFQIIGINGKGKTLGFNATQYTGGNSPAVTGAYSIYWGSNVAVISNATDSIAAGDSLALAWPAIPGATGYDVLISTNGSTWASLATNQSGTTFSYTGQSTSAYTLPASNSTAIGSDSNSGTSSGSPLATLAKAATLAATGDSIVVSGFVVDTAQVVWNGGVTGVTVQGASDRYSCFLYSTYAGGLSTHVAYTWPANSLVADLTLMTDANTQALSGSVGTDPNIVGIDMFRCRLLGLTHVVRINTAGLNGLNLWDCDMYSDHGNFGIVAGVTNTVVNLTRTSNQAVGSPQNVLNGVNPVAMTQAAGYLCSRDSLFTSSNDSWTAIAGTQNVCINGTTSANKSLMIINGKLRAPGAANGYEFYSPTASNYNIDLNNTPYDSIRNVLGATPNVTNDGTYQSDPMISGIATTCGINTGIGLFANQ